LVFDRYLLRISRIHQFIVAISFASYAGESLSDFLRDVRLTLSAQQALKVKAARSRDTGDASCVERGFNDSG
jgi:hypothetical protein